MIIKSLIRKYKEEQLQDLFMNGTYDYLSDENYIKCIAMEKEVEELVGKYVENIKTMQNVLKRVSKETNISNTLHLVETILLDFYGDFVQIGILNLTYSQQLKDTCEWIKKLIRDDRDKTFNICELFGKTLSSIPKVNAAFGNITTTYNQKSIAFTWGL